MFPKLKSVGMRLRAESFHRIRILMRIARVQLAGLMQVQKKWSDVDCETNIKDEYDGKGNTERIIAYGKVHVMSFPAAEWCTEYSKNGVRPGEGFMPAREQ